MKKLSPEKAREMRVLLKAAFDAVAAESTPKCLDELVRKLN